MLPHTEYHASRTPAQRRKGGGTGRGPQSYWKHDQIEAFMGRQLPVLRKFGRGLIIDMHAGDGKQTAHPIPDMFAGGSIKSTPALAIAMGERFGADVWLCERSYHARQALTVAYGDRADILRNNRTLLRNDRLAAICESSWLLVLNDPNGYGQQSVDVMQALAAAVPKSDFIIVVNAHPFKRTLALRATDPMSTRSRESGEQNVWMLDPDQWRQRLGKRQCLVSAEGKLSAAMQARVHLVSNYIPGYNR